MTNHEDKEAGVVVCQPVQGVAGGYTGNAYQIPLGLLLTLVAFGVPSVFAFPWLAFDPSAVFQTTGGPCVAVFLPNGYTCDQRDDCCDVVDNLMQLILQN